MSPLTRLNGHLHSLRKKFVRQELIESEDGTVLMEFAAGLTFFMIIGFGGAEYVNYITTHASVSQLALTVADNASRTQSGTSLTLPRMREVDINEIFKGAELQSQKLDVKNRGKVILSSLEVVNGSQNIRWQRCFGNGPYQSSYGREGNNVAGGMGPAGNKVTAVSGSAVMFVEVIYPYKPILYANWLGEANKKMQYTAAFQIRDARDLNAGLTNPSPAATPQRCT